MTGPVKQFQLSNLSRDSQSEKKTIRSLKVKTC